MQVEKKDLGKAQYELIVTLDSDEIKAFEGRAAKLISENVKIPGFRPGHAPLEQVKQAVGAMAVLEEAARLAIDKTWAQAAKELERETVGRPEIDVTKLAPGNPLEYRIKLSLAPEIKLGAYKDLGVEPKKALCEESESRRALEELQESRVSEALVSRAATQGDRVLIDINMWQDNVPVEGGQSKDISVILGKEYIVPGFDKEIQGLSKGDEKEFKLPYPESFHMKNLAGKIVNFKIKINDVYERQMPELSDDFAKSFGTKSLDDLKKAIEVSIVSRRQEQNDAQAEREMLEKIAEASAYSDIAGVLVDQESHAMLHEMEEAVTGQGGKFEDYLKAIGKSADQLRLDFAPDAMKRVKVSLALRQIAKTENIIASKEEVEDYIKHVLEHYRQQGNTPEGLQSASYREYIGNVIVSRKTAEALREWNFKKE